jgi:DNA-binding HxlR family transcriptional regulator
VLGRTYENQVCSVARALEVLGERWTLLIVRDALLGLRRFDDFQRSLGLARNVLTDRLGRLVDAGILERVPYQDRPVRHEYQLTPMGRELGLPVIGLMQWGDRHLADAAGAPRVAQHHECGGAVRLALACDTCGVTVAPGDVDLVAGPGIRA